MSEMRLLVCGGRDFRDVPLLWSILDGIHERQLRAEIRISCLINGGQKKVLPDRRVVGADYWAHQWALARNIPTMQFMPDWDGEGKAAGPRRNRRMFDEGKPTHGLAMPGGRGTAHMVSIMKPHIPVWRF